MARKPKITEEQILDAAKRMFRRHGFGVTTSQIAEEAGISEGSIFRHFRSKHDLMTCALGIKAAHWIDKVEALDASDEPVEVQLTTLVTEVLDFFVENLPKMMAVVSAGADIRQKFLKSPESPPIEGIRTISNYFDRLRISGKIRTVDPEILSRMVIGSCHYYAFTDYVGINQFMPMPKETYIRGVVDNLLRGIGPINE